MKKPLLFILILCCISFTNAQKSAYWKKTNQKDILKSKIALRSSFPENFTLFETQANFYELLQNAPNRITENASSVVLELPNFAGFTERFQVFEFSNFDPQLQAQYPNIRSYVGAGIDDASAKVRFSLDESGLQAMIFRVGKPTEFIEVYSENKKIYAVHEASRKNGELPFVCSTDDVMFLKNMEKQTEISTNKSSSGQLLIFRLALSCNGEYTNFFGGTIAGALAAMNATMTRVNGVFENDFTIHMNIIANNTDIIFTNPTTDPYSSLGNWNNELQTTLTTTIGEANYDVGHMFGASGGGGNAGCIGCVCTDGSKGSGITSPSNGVPAGDTFDIDYVAHELGHQFGGNHTFSHNVEGSGVNVEPGSGSTIMGYAGITNRDVQSNSDAYFVYASIKQVEDNMVGKTCPVRINLGRIIPIVNAGLDYTIPRSTPFVLSGSVVNTTNPAFSYCWEQNDTATTQTNAQSGASATKTGGPNFRSYNPVATPTRYFPRLQSVIANSNTTQGLEIATEALNSNARVLNFVLTARDNFPGSGQTGSDATKITVNSFAGPFLVTSPNLATESWTSGTNQTVTWNVAGTTANNINAAFVDIFLSTDGGFTYPILLASKVPNDGSETVTAPNVLGTTNRVMIKGYQHVFYDISNFNFPIVAPTTNFAIAFNGVSEQQNKETCASTTAVIYDIPYTTFNGFSGLTTFTVSGLPANAVATFSQTTATTAGTINLSVTTANVVAGDYNLLVTATSGATIVTVPFYLKVYSGAFGAVSIVAPVNAATVQPVNLNLTWQAEGNATAYDIQLSTDSNFVNNVQNFVSTSTTTAATNLLELTDYYWRIKPKNPACSGVFGAIFNFRTGATICGTNVTTNIPVTIPTTANATVNSTLTVADTSIIADINVNINVSHTWVNDMTITLISPAGTQVQLVANPCASSALNNIVATFDDAGTAIICGNNPAISGIVKPSQLLSAFNGETANGVWTLRVLDSFAQDGGTINSWTLNVCNTQAALNVASTSLQDLSIFPNPATNQITVQFTPQSADTIELALFDLRGRQISSKKYANSGVFMETISIADLESGVYLIKIKEGKTVATKKVVKN